MVGLEVIDPVESQWTRIDTEATSYECFFIAKLPEKSYTMGDTVVYPDLNGCWFKDVVDRERGPGRRVFKAFLGKHRKEHMVVSEILGADISEAEFHLNLDEDSLSSNELVPGDTPFIAYTVYKSRKVHIPNAATIKWLKEVRDKKARSERVHREAFYIACLEFISRLPNGTIPVKNLYSHTFSSIAHGPLGPLIRTHYDGDLSILTVLVKALELSDTPTWVSLADALILRLMNTDIAGILCDDVKLPMPCLLIELPEGLCEMDVEKDGQTFHIDAGAVSVYEDRYFSDEFPDGVRSIRLFYLSSCDQGILSMQGAVVHLYSGETEEVAIDDRMLEYKSVGKTSAAIYGNSASVEEVDRVMATLVLNIIVYMNSQKGPTRKQVKTITKKFKKRSKRNGYRKGPVDLAKYDQWVYGTDVELKDDDREVFSNPFVGKRNKMKLKWARRGGWRDQACGKGWKLRKRIWIHPQVCNRNVEGAIMGHTYKGKAEEVKE